MTKTTPTIEKITDPRDAAVEALALLDRFAHQRPGFEFDNYGNLSAYRADYRRTLRDLHDFETLHADATGRAGALPAPQFLALLLAAFRRAFSGRLSLHSGPDGLRIGYTAGQYAPIEYRAAACAVLADLLWQIEGEAGAYQQPGGAHLIRETARDRFGLGIARRWFDYR